MWLTKEKLYLLGDPYEISMKIGSEMLASEGDIVPAKQALTKFDPFSESILTEHSGKVHLFSIIPGTTMKQEVDEVTGSHQQHHPRFPGRGAPAQDRDRGR